MGGCLETEDSDNGLNGTVCPLGLSISLWVISSGQSNLGACKSGQGRPKRRNEGAVAVAYQSIGGPPYRIDMVEEAFGKCLAQSSELLARQKAYGFRELVSNNGNAVETAGSHWKTHNEVHANSVEGAKKNGNGL